MKRLLLMALFGFSFAQETYYCVQLGSFIEAKNAQELFLKVKDLPQARVEKIENLYKVLVGFYKNKAEAQRLLEEVKRRNFKDAFLRTCDYIPSRIIISNFHELKDLDQKEEFGIKDSTPKGKPDEEFYRLLVQALLGGKKIDSALKVIKEALSYFPKSYYWWKLYGDVLLWNSQPQEALEAYLKAYELSPSKSLAERIFNLALSLSRFDVAQRFLDKVDVPPKVRIYVYESTGDIESLINYLKKLKTKEGLILLAQIQFSLGEKEEALKALELHDELYGKSADSVLLRANILFSEKKYDEALRVLKENYESFKDDTEFLRTLSDLAWMLGDYDTAWKSSERLVELGKGEDADYERLGYKYAIANPKRAIELSLEAYEKFKRRFFLEFSIFTAFNNSLWKEVVEITERYKDEVFKSPYTFIAYATALDKLGKTNYAIQLIEDYLTKNFSKEVLNFYIYLLAEKRDFKKLNKVVWDYRRYEKDKELALAFAYAYTVLQNGSRALEIYNASPKKDEVLYGDILYLIGKEEEARSHRLKTYRKLREELKDNPELLKSPEFLRTYLSLGMEFMTPAEFEKLLQ